MSNQTLFDIQEIFNDINRSGGTKLKVGKHDNVKLSEVEVGETFIDFHFEKDGQVANKRIWFPDIEKVYQKTDSDGTPKETKEQALVREGKDSLSHIVKIMNIFLGENIVKTFQPSTFEDTAKRAASMLNAAKDATTVNLLLIYDKNGQWSTFGKYPNYIEEHIPGIPNGLKPSNWEMENRMSPKETPDTDLSKGDSITNMY